MDWGQRFTASVSRDVRTPPGIECPTVRGYDALFILSTSRRRGYRSEHARCRDPGPDLLVIPCVGILEEGLTALKAFGERVESVIIETAKHALHYRTIPFW